MPKNISVSITGVEVKELISHADNRGFFREIIRDSDPVFSTNSDEQSFMQWSHSKMAKNTVKAWHFHHRQIDWWYLGLGAAEVGLIDNRPESSTYKERMTIILSGDPTEDEGHAAVIKIPQGVLHGCKVLTKFAHLFYITSHIYDPKDEGRIPFNDPEIAYDWGSPEELIIAKNDTMHFQPAYDRVLS